MKPDLIKRLRDHTVGPDGRDEMLIEVGKLASLGSVWERLAQTIKTYNDLMTEAADALEAQRAEGVPSEADHLRMQIGYIATELMVRGDPRSLPEIVETAAKATARRESGPNGRHDG